MDYSYPPIIIKYIKQGDLFIMKTITLTDDQFDTLFEYVDDKVTTIVDASVEYQDSEMLEEWEDLLDVHTILEETKIEYEKKLEKARAKQPKAAW